MSQQSEVRTSLSLGEAAQLLGVSENEMLQRFKDVQGYSDDE